MSKEPVDRTINARYSYTKQYTSLKVGLAELFEIVPTLKESIFDTDISNFARFLATDSDEDAAKVIFGLATNNVMQDFPSIYDDIYPATLALSITGDRFFYRSKNRVSLIWEYDRSFRKTGIVLINITIQFKEPTNRLRSKIFSQNIEALKEVGYEYNSAYDSSYKRNNNQESESQQ